VRDAWAADESDEECSRAAFIESRPSRAAPDVGLACESAANGTLAPNARITRNAQTLFVMIGAPSIDKVAHLHQSAAKHHRCVEMRLQE
jgi:hypothetical protein